MQGFPFVLAPTKNDHLDVFLDLQCPYSRKTFLILAPLLEEIPQLTVKIHLTSLHFHFSAFLAQQAAYVVHNIGGQDALMKYFDAFWTQKKQELLFNAKTGDLTRNQVVGVLSTIVKDIGINTQEFLKGMANDDIVRGAWVAQKYSIQQGVAGTPKVFINGFPSDAQSSWNVEQYKAALAKL